MKLIAPIVSCLMLTASLVLHWHAGFQLHRAREARREVNLLLRRAEAILARAESMKASAQGRAPDDGKTEPFD